MRSTALAGDRAGRIGKRTQFGLGHERTDELFRRGIFLCIECRAERAHESRNRRTDDLFARLLLKGAKHGVVEEGSPLHDDMFTEFLGRAGTDDFINGVFDDG